MRVSILDIHPPIYLPDIVELAEEAGYHRYWVTEHHTPLQSASPTLATALAGGMSERLRVGMGGVLLRMHSPLRVAGDIALLRTFFPARIDLGIAGAHNGDDLSRALSGEVVADDTKYQARIEALIELVAGHRSVPCGDLVRDEAPQVWLCGTSAGSARLAGTLGLRYAYHHHLRPLSGSARLALSAAYREAFRASAVTAAPYMAIAAYGAVGSSEALARDEWQKHTGSSGQPSFCGAPSSAANQLHELAASYGADELFVDCFAGSITVRVNALRSLATSLRLREHAGEPSLAAMAAPA